MKVSIVEQLLESAYETLRAAERSGDEKEIEEAQKKVDEIHEALNEV